MGSTATVTLLHAFCSTNSILNLITHNHTDCIQTNTVEMNIQSVEHANKVYMKFLPSSTIMNRIETFDSFNPLNFGQLIENEPKILFASRHNAQPDFFYKSIEQYIEGFGDGQFNFWIGLDTLQKVTNAHNYKLRVVATTTNNIDFVEEYLVFRVANRTDQFKLTVSGLILGTNAFFSKSSGTTFSTFDYGNKLLAQSHASGFWHTDENHYCFSCSFANYEIGSSTKISLSEAKKIEVFSTKMYLVVSDFKNKKFLPLKTVCCLSFKFFL
jgi:hypothetical protein